MSLSTREARLRAMIEKGQTLPKVIFEVENLINGSMTHVPGPVIGRFLDGSAYKIRQLTPKEVGALKKGEPVESGGGEGDED